MRARCHNRDARWLKKRGVNFERTCAGNSASSFGCSKQRGDFMTKFLLAVAFSLALSGAAFAQKTAKEQIVGA
jgi:hypothetical protein